METNWNEFLSTVPVVVGLARGWFAFNFAEVAHPQKVLARNWALDHSPFLLKPWNPMFDVSRERVDVVLIWVCLLGIPLHYWIENHLRNIGNLLG